MAVEDPADARRSVPAPGPDDEEYAALADALRDAVAGRVRFDEYAQVLYASDGSIYQARPAGVVEPSDEDDVRAAIRVAADHDVPVIARGAGSSLGGQAVGPGCVVLDLSVHMDAVVDLDAEAKRITVEPGVVQDDLDDYLAPHGLKFAPDPASSNRATIGGGIGNNSTGAHSVRYGITDAYTAGLRVVLADGSVITTREVVLDGDEWDELVARDDRTAELHRTVRSIVEDHAAEIADRYPDLKRCVTGYNLDRVIYENEDGERVMNLSRLIVGSESTLGIVTEATLELVTRPAETALALYCFADLLDALRAVPVALEYDVGAVELMDAEVFRLAAASDGYAEYAAPIPDGTAAALMLEFDGELVDSFPDAIAATNDRFLEAGRAFEVIEAYDRADQDRLWKLRKAAIPLLMSLEGDAKPYPFIEDATVPPAELADYVAAFEEILDDHGTSAAYFAHAGSGTLHIRPILSLKEENGIETMHSITDAVTDLVLEHHGAFSGEHGDGMARTEFTPKMYGPDLWAAFKEIKTAFDPDWLLHPGNVIYRDGPEDVGPASDRGVGADMREDLRYGAAYQSIEPQTTLDFADEGGFSHLVELCNGCGTCRQTDQDVMCPTYRATKDEQLTTRGRANMLRAAISGEIDEAELYGERFQSGVLDLCVGCKGCQTDCPTGVDLAKLKAEVKHRYHEREGVDLRTRLFTNLHRLAPIGSATAPVSNWLQALPGGRAVAERLVGIAADRSLPRFRRRTLADVVADREPLGLDVADRKVLLFPDVDTVYSHPERGLAAIRVLEAAGVHVHLPEDLGPSGRAAYSLGRLDLAAGRAADVIETVAPYLETGWELVALEPSDAVMIQDEYRSLLGGDAAELAAHTYGVCEYLDVYDLATTIPFETPPEPVAYHGHCHQHAQGTDGHAVAVLAAAGYDVDELETGCCGMAGSFGYEAEHYALSRAIGRDLETAVERSDADRVLASGVSCRTQLLDGPVGGTRHPIEAVADVLPE